MVATSRHHGMPALGDAKDWLQGAVFNLWTSDPKHRNHQPNTTQLEYPPARPWPLLAICPAGTAPAWTGCGGRERGRAVGRVGLWEGGAAKALFAYAPEAVPTCPYPRTFLSRTAPATDLAVMEVAGCTLGTLARSGEGVVPLPLGGGGGVTSLLLLHIHHFVPTLCGPPSPRAVLLPRRCPGIVYALRGRS